MQARDAKAVRPARRALTLCAMRFKHLPTRLAQALAVLLQASQHAQRIGNLLATIRRGIMAARGLLLRGALEFQESARRIVLRRATVLRPRRRYGDDENRNRKEEYACRSFHVAGLPFDLRCRQQNIDPIVPARSSVRARPDNASPAFDGCGVIHVRDGAGEDLQNAPVPAVDSGLLRRLSPPPTTVPKSLLRSLR